jgi:hypothetical protein
MATPGPVINGTVLYLLFPGSGVYISGNSNRDFNCILTPEKKADQASAVGFDEVAAHLANDGPHS